MNEPNFSPAMKWKQFLTVAVCALGLLAPSNIRAQSTTYLSNTNQPIAGANTISPLLGVQFQTGSNAAGYTFNDVQLSMGNAVQNPTGSLFVYLYYPSPVIGGPDSFTDILSGNTNPVTAGIYLYLATSNIVLLPNTTYYIQAEIGGANPDYYKWNYTSSTNATSIDGWGITGYQYNVHSGFTPDPMLAIDATPIGGAPPLLTITPNGANAIISWPVAAGNFGLESATVGTNFALTNGITGLAQFFRLKSN